MSNLSTWSSTDDNNNRVPPDGFPENQSPSSVNNSARAMMGGIRRAYLEQPYFNPGGTVLYINESTFQIKDTSEITDFSVFYPVGRRVKIVSASGVKYGNVGAVTYSGGSTEIKLAIDSDGVLDSTTSAVYCGLTRDDTGEIVGRLPVGMILPYTSMDLPAGFLYADGKSFDPEIYTELARIWKTGENEYLYGQEVVGGKYWVKTPDVRGQFPRYLDMGAGIDPDGETRIIGEVQTDAIRNITGVVASAYGGTKGGTQTGPFSYVDTNGLQDGGDGSDGEPIRTSDITFDASSIVPTAEENRPTNMAFPALIVAWHGITPAENISIQDLLEAFNQMQGSIDQIYTAKDEALVELQTESQAIVNQSRTSISYASSTAIAEVESAVANKSAEITNLADTKISAIQAQGDSEIARVETAGSEEIAVAESWAVAPIEERAEGSAKYWAEKAKENAGGSGTNDHTMLVNRDVADQHAIAAVRGLQAALDTKATTNALTNGLDTKQNTLTAGDNITIENDVISSSGGANTSLSNLTTQGQEKVANLAMPSDVYIDITPLTSGSNYTAPAEGYYTASVQNGLAVFTGEINSGVETTTNFNHVYLPVRKGQVIVFYYSGTVYSFRFVYAEGSKPQ